MVAGQVSEFLGGEGIILEITHSDTGICRNRRWVAATRVKYTSVFTVRISYGPSRYVTVVVTPYAARGSLTPTVAFNDSGATACRPLSTSHALNSQQLPNDQQTAGNHRLHPQIFSH